MTVQVKQRFSNFNDVLEYLQEANKVYRMIRSSYTYEIGFESFNVIVVTIKPYYGLQED
jgi:uncharacterized membrane protein YpjA